jgi:hypothetical protein
MHAPNAGHCFAPRHTQKTGGSLLTATKMDRKIALAGAPEFQNRDPVLSFSIFHDERKGTSISGGMPDFNRMRERKHAE